MTLLKTNLRSCVTLSELQLLSTVRRHGVASQKIRNVNSQGLLQITSAQLVNTVIARYQTLRIIKPK